MKNRSVYIVEPKGGGPDYEIGCDFMSYTEYGFVAFKNLVVDTKQRTEYQTTLLLPSDAYHSIRLKGEN